MIIQNRYQRDRTQVQFGYEKIAVLESSFEKIQSEIIEFNSRQKSAETK